MGDGRRFRLCMAASLCLAVSVAAGQQAKTVIGPTNPELHDGAQALLAGDAQP